MSPNQDAEAEEIYGRMWIQMNGWLMYLLCGSLTSVRSEIIRLRDETNETNSLTAAKSSHENG